MTDSLRLRIAARISIEDHGFSTPCWVWKGHIGKTGYGRLSVCDRTRSVHRVSYEAFKGQIPVSLVIDHLCRVRACCNPDHLEPVTTRENLARSPLVKLPKPYHPTRCPKGHEYTPENSMKRSNGYRQCMECSRQQGRDARARKRMAGNGSAPEACA